MDYYYNDHINDENDCDDEHDMDTYIGKLHCLSKATQSCNKMLEALRRTVLEEEELTTSELEERHASLLRSAVLINLSVYRDLNARFPMNKIYRKMKRLIQVLANEKPYRKKL